MDQTGSLSDTLAKSSSLLSGLLLQMGTALGSKAAQNGAFSNLIAQSDATQNALAAQTQVQTQSQTSTGTQAAATTSCASGVSATAEQTIHTVAEVTSSLRKMLGALREKSSGTAPSKDKETTEKTTSAASSAASADVASAAPAAKATPKTTNEEGDTSGVATDAKTVVTTSEEPQVVVEEDTTTTETTDTALSASSTEEDPAQTIDRMISELLAMAQLILQKLEQTPVAAGDTAIVSIVAAVAANMKDIGDLVSGLSAGKEIAQSEDVAGTQDTADIADQAAALINQILSPTTEDDTDADPVGDALTKALTVTSQEGKTLVAAALTDMEKKVRKLLAAVLEATAPTKTKADKDQAVVAAVDTTVSALVAEDVGTKEKTVAPLDAVAAAVVEAAVSTAAPVAQQIVDTVVSSSVKVPLVSLAPEVKSALAAIQQQTQNPSGVAKNAAQVQQQTLPTAAAVETAEVETSAKAATVAQNPFLASASTKEAEKNDKAATTTTLASTTLASTSEAGIKAGSNKQTESDLLSGGGHQAGFADTGAKSATPLSAGGTQAMGTYNFASTLSAFRAVNGGTAGLPSVVDQVILQMNRNVKNGNDQMSLQLQPGDLGKITVKLNISADGKVQGTVTADNPQTLDMLQKDSRSLERALQDAGLRADPGSLQFSLGQNSQNMAGQSGKDGLRAVNADGTITAQDSDETLVDIGAIAETYYLTPRGVNIRV